ncbi:MAG: NADH-quinone oxidoreductase subunit K [Bdellovibrionales bacterium GWB1_55_8]|nr:MAG: NADH-quinone oxidoreductase subunit K [Bdellovibrionales bacterium GWB1_55_8]
MLDTLVGNAPGVFHWLVLSTAMFSIGIYGLLTRRNAVGILMSIELLLNSASLNFIIFNRFVTPVSVDGEVMSIFIIAVAAAEVVVGMAIFVALYKSRKTVDVTQMNLMRN